MMKIPEKITNGTPIKFFLGYIDDNKNDGCR